MNENERKQTAQTRSASERRRQRIEADPAWWPGLETIVARRHRILRPWAAGVTSVSEILGFVATALFPFAVIQFSQFRIPYAEALPRPCLWLAVATTTMSFAFMWIAIGRPLTDLWVRATILRLIAAAEVAMFVTAILFTLDALGGASFSFAGPRAAVAVLLGFVLQLVFSQGSDSLDARTAPPQLSQN